MPAHPKFFSQFPADVFFETGTYEGLGVQYALNCGFPLIVTVEIFEPLFIKAKEKFANNSKVICLLGSGSEQMFNILPKIKDKKITFWLDGHYSGNGTGGELNLFPMIEELKQIKNWYDLSNKKYKPTILIDDFRCYREKENDIIELIKSIDSSYNIEYLDGFQEHTGVVFKNDIITARG